MSKPSLPQGMRDFNAETVRKRNYIFSTIREVFELYGFQPLETPAMENLETLMGKYGEEGDRLIFKVLNNGLADPKNSGKATEGFQKVLEGKNSALLTERALKYDLTIPFARFVAMNHGQLTFPYKRYQMQPVWRADRPQKGRYREFTQCDADVVGSTSLMNEVDLLHIYHDVFTRLGLPDYRLHLNSRKLLESLADRCGGQEKLTHITTAIDKLDKIGIEKVRIELTDRGITADELAVIEDYLNISGTNEEMLRAVGALFGGNPKSASGIADLTHIAERTQSVNLVIDFTLARGLNYYTGAIMEVKPPANVQMGSIGGGGRYDDLTGLFGVPNIPGVGVSFGVDRIFDVIEELGKFPASLSTGSTALFFNLGAKECETASQLAQDLRRSGISCEVYADVAKMDKQFRYAEKKLIRFAVIIGSTELERNEVLVKELSSGQQVAMPADKLIPFLFNKLS